MHRDRGIFRYPGCDSHAPFSQSLLTTGSAFELVNPDPRFGFATTAVLALVAIPLCFFLFYASILKATAETEADDKEFMKGRY